MYTCQWEQSFLCPTSLANAPAPRPASWGCWGMQGGWATICQGTGTLHRSKNMTILSRLALSGPAVPMCFFPSEPLSHPPLRRGGQCVSQTPLVTRPMSFSPETVPVDTWWLTDVGAKGGKPDVSLFLQETPKERRCFLWVLWYLETQKSSWPWKRARLRAELTCQQYRKDRGRAGVARPLLSHPWECSSRFPLGHEKTQYPLGAGLAAKGCSPYPVEPSPRPPLVWAVPEVWPVICLR